MGPFMTAPGITVRPICGVDDGKQQFAVAVDRHLWPNRAKAVKAACQSIAGLPEMDRFTIDVTVIPTRRFPDVSTN